MAFVLRLTEEETELLRAPSVVVHDVGIEKAADLLRRRTAPR